MKVVCLRDRYANQERAISHSLVLHVKIEPEACSEGQTYEQPLNLVIKDNSVTQIFLLLLKDVKFVGWEKWNGKLQPRLVNLSSTMNPVK